MSSSVPLASSLLKHFTLAFSLRQVEQLFSARAWHLPLWKALGPTDLLVSSLLSSSCLFLSLLSSCQRPTLGYSSDRNEKDSLCTAWLLVSVNKLYVFGAPVVCKSSREIFDVCPSSQCYWTTLLTVHTITGMNISKSLPLQP